MSGDWTYKLIMNNGDLVDVGQSKAQAMTAYEWNKNAAALVKSVIKEDLTLLRYR